MNSNPTQMPCSTAPVDMVVTDPEPRVEPAERKDALDALVRLADHLQLGTRSAATALEAVAASIRLHRDNLQSVVMLSLQLQDLGLTPAQIDPLLASVNRDTYRSFAITSKIADHAKSMANHVVLAAKSLTVAVADIQRQSALLERESQKLREERRLNASLSAELLDHVLLVQQALMVVQPDPDGHP